MDQSAFILRTTAVLLLLACVTWGQDGGADLEIEIEQHDVGVGDTFSMSCIGGGEEINWWKVIKSTDDRHEVNTRLSQSQLEITSAELSDAGDYYCGHYKKIAVNVLGADDIDHIIDKGVADVTRGVNVVINTLKTLARESEVVYRLVGGEAERLWEPRNDAPLKNK